MKKSKIINTIMYILLLISFGFTCRLIYQQNRKEQVKVEENKKIQEFFEGEEIEIKNNKKEKPESYLGILEIPSIQLKKGFYAINSNKNKVSQNIQVLTESTMPDQKGNFILASHSGNGWNAFFKDLNKVEVGQKVFIYYDGIKYCYQIYDKYLEKKTGFISVSYTNKQMITLTTCSQEHKGNQIIVLGILIQKEMYERT